jgi:hypothetical protein
VYASGVLDYASAAGNQARDINQLANGNAEVELKRAKNIKNRSKTGKTSANLKLKEAGKIGHLKVAKGLVKTLPVLAALLNLADAVSDVIDCFQKCKRK